MSNMCVTNAYSSQINSITTRAMCDAAITKVRFDRVQFIRRASIPFSLPHFMIVLSQIWNEIRGWTGHFIVKTVELRAAFAASSARSLKIMYSLPKLNTDWVIQYCLVLQDYLRNKKLKNSDAHTTNMPERQCNWISLAVTKCAKKQKPGHSGQTVTRILMHTGLSNTCLLSCFSNEGHL